MKSKSFTLIELLITVSIILIFIVINIPRFNHYNQQIRLKKNTTVVFNALELAKKKAFSSDLFDPNCAEFEGYQIIVGSDSSALVFRCGGASTQTQTYTLDANISITSGLGTFTFPPALLGIDPTLLGIGQTSATIRVRNSIISECMDITISKIGVISTTGLFFSC